MLKILHITPHLGGGVGSVVLNWMNKDTSGNIHTIISLDKNNNSDWVKTNESCPLATIYGNCFFQNDFNTFLDKLINDADIILVHWWNHPLLYAVLINHDFPPCRLIIWNHVSSLFPPYTMSEKLINFADYLVFTSPVSYECPEIKNLSEKSKKKLDVIWSTVGVEDFKELPRTPHEDFIVGYTGTVNFGKLHPNYIKMCSQVNLPDVKFVVCSGDSQQHLIDEAKKLNIFDRFSFEGRVPSIVPYVATFDVFGYPLQPQHFATCEQSIGEAMMAGAVPVVFSNITEKYIIKHMETGLVVNNEKEYAKAIKYLYHNRDILKKLSYNAQEFAKKQYDITKTISQWNSVFEKVMQYTKINKFWKKQHERLYPWQLYIESLGNHGTSLQQYINAQNIIEKELALKEIKQLFNSNTMFYSKNKGSVLQYVRYFPDDKNLQEWSKLVE